MCVKWIGDVDGLEVMCGVMEGVVLIFSLDLIFWICLSILVSVDVCVVVRVCLNVVIICIFRLLYLL